MRALILCGVLSSTQLYLIDLRNQCHSHSLVLPFYSYTQAQEIIFEYLIKVQEERDVKKGPDQK